MPAGINLSDFYYILPELVLTGGALLVLVADVLLPRGSQALAWLTVLVLGATIASLAPFTGVRVEIAHGLIAVDQFAIFFKAVFLVAAIMTVMMSVRYLEIEGASPGEYYFLVLCATLGMMIMAAGIDLITTFIGLETMAVSFYILAGFIKPNQRSNEAAVKYFLLGAFADVRAVRNDEPAGDGCNLRRTGARSAPCARRDSGRGRHWLQDRGRPVPYVGAGRL
jgi:NADH-quinone oxidoreductase subunit N